MRKFAFASVLLLGAASAAPAQQWRAGLGPYYRTPYGGVQPGYRGAYRSNLQQLPYGGRAVISPYMAPYQGQRGLYSPSPLLPDPYVKRRTSRDPINYWDP